MKLGRHRAAFFCRGVISINLYRWRQLVEINLVAIKMAAAFAVWKTLRRVFCVAFRASVNLLRYSFLLGAKGVVYTVRSLCLGLRNGSAAL